MKDIKYTMLILFFLVLFCACSKEEDLTADFEATGPYPEIVLGDTEASQIRYGIYEDYDIHIYYELSGEEAMTTPNGRIQSNALKNTYVTRADESRAVIFLKLMREMFDFFSDNREIQKYRRYVLISDLGATTTADKYYSYGYNLDFYSETRGWYVLGSVNDTKDFDLFLTKECLLYTFFGSTFNYYFSVPENFKGLSAGNYYDELSEEGDPIIRSSVYHEDEAIAAGFIHPYGTYAYADYPYQDWASYVVWIISRPKAERDPLLTTNSIIQKKYDIIVAYMLENYGMDMEAVSTAWQSIGTDL